MFVTFLLCYLLIGGLLAARVLYVHKNVLWAEIAFSIAFWPLVLWFVVVEPD